MIPAGNFFWSSFQQKRTGPNAVEGQQRCCCSYNKQSTSKHLLLLHKGLKKIGRQLLLQPLQKKHIGAGWMDPTNNLGGLDHSKSLHLGFKSRNITMTYNIRGVFQWEGCVQIESQREWIWSGLYIILWSDKVCFMRKPIWKLKVPLKIKIFLWYLKQGGNSYKR